MGTETKERNSELKLIVVYMIFLGGWLWGVDVQQIILLLVDSEQWVKDIRSLVMESSDKDAGAIIGGLVTAVYAGLRTWRKRELVK